LDNTLFKTQFEVRDNEIDIQGIVNNTNYMVYLAHARHKYINALGINFSDYAAQGLNLVLLSCNLTFKQSLRPDDTFYVTCEVKPTDSPIRFAFYQEIRLSNTDQLIAKAELMATCVNEHAKTRAERIFIPDDVKRLLES